MPSPSRRKLNASSKSFASSGSIVNAKRSRRSVRSGSISSGGGGTGACDRRTPSCQSSPSSTAPTSPGRPSTASTLARPRPRRRTTRSPADASPLPLRSTVTGTPPSKNGSPTRSFPRLASSATSDVPAGGAPLRARESSGGQGRRELAYRIEIRERPRTPAGEDLQPREPVPVTGRDISTPRGYAASLPASTRSAARIISSRSVSGSLSTFTEGRMPRPARSVPDGVQIRGRGELEGTARGEGPDRLHRGLAVGALSDDDRALIVGKRRGDDLGGARASPVYEHGHRQPRELRSAAHLVHSLFLVQARDRADDTPVAGRPRRCARLR